MRLSDTTFPLEMPDRPVSAIAPAQPLAAHASWSLAEQIVIEPARLRDWRGICMMVARNFPLETEQNMGYWLCHQLPYFRVARLGDAVVGFLHAQPRRDTGTLWVNMLAVDERYRHRGVAHRMVEHFESVCRDWQCQRVGLQCLTSNLAALNLYQRHGYARLDESTTELGLQVVCHTKALSVTDAPRSCPRPEVQLDGRVQRLAYRLFYLAWFRSRSPMLD
jgi:GNAT superfamily N-acetyltransferase